MTSSTVSLSKPNLIAYRNGSSAYPLSDGNRRCSEGCGAMELKGPPDHLRG
jgi:hypothetical protein